MRIPMCRKCRHKADSHIRNAPDSHQWVTKMEIHHLLSGKPDLKLKRQPKTGD